MEKMEKIKQVLIDHWYDYLMKNSDKFKNLSMDRQGEIVVKIAEIHLNDLDFLMGIKKLLDKQVSWSKGE